LIPRLGKATEFPALDRALTEPNGLLAAGGDLSVERLIAAYRRGIFPWFSDGQPILWWSPDPRMVLFPQELRIGRSLAKTLRKDPYEIRCDTAFRDVMRACAQPRRNQDGTWITDTMIDAYCDLHTSGLAHSVEAWQADSLVGGLYGVAIGRMFFGESMFAVASDASKIAFVHLVRLLSAHGFGMIDCQMRTDLLAAFGAREIPRQHFAARLAELVHYPHPMLRWPSVLNTID